MMSASQIISMQDEAAAKAAAERKHPLVLWSADDLFRAPFLGGYEAPGWRALDPEEVEHLLPGKVVSHMDDLEGGVVDLFCDSSGWGAPNEMALTGGQVYDVVEDLLAWAREQGVALGASIQQVGQFQVYVRLHAKKE